MSKAPLTPDRRQFLQTLTAGAALSPSLLLWNQQARADKPTSHLVTGDIVRTSGELSADGSKLIESQREIPVAGTTDVIVCGGGPAGIGAALGAARAGASVRLIEMAGCLGGVWTAGLLTRIIDGHSKSGVMKEILNGLAERGSDVAKKSKGEIYDPELCKLLLEEMCVKDGVKIHLHTHLVGAVLNDRNQIVGVLTESKSGRQAWVAQRFVDCSGDGDLAAQAGCSFDLGVGEKCECQPMSMIALLTGVDPTKITEFIRETGESAKPKLRKLMQQAGVDPSYSAPTLRHLHSGIYSLMTNHEYGVSAMDEGQITEATIRARAEVHHIVNTLRKLGDPWTNLAVVATAEQIGVREGRRIRGRYTVTGEDIVAGATHPDSVCRVNFGFDVHNVFSDGSNPVDVAKFRKMGSKPYDVPLAALIAADVDGLLMAGRCISGDFIAHSSYRVTGNSVPMGEAAGKVAAVSVQKGVMPHEISYAELAQNG
ncbi:FAD-dependent oxidoreductase [Planctomicrobium sp. SH664]|uniref:FAD-dependent oxidoreductase n=1 Tax=Planctomicrobium sp. SH664 TaxID=3448125 RepID=UPI003F5BB29F